MLTAMAPLFQMRGVQCDVLALVRRPSPFDRLLKEHNISLCFTGVREMYSPRQILALARHIEGYDIVHVHLFPAQLWTALAAAGMSHPPPLVTTEHNAWNARRRWWLRPVDLWMYSRYSRIACISEASAESLRRWCPRVTKSITIVPNGISLDIFEKALPAKFEHIPKDAVKLVFVGRCDQPKDHATILRAMRDLPNAHLLLVGDGPLRRDLERLTRDLGVNDRVSFLGWRSDVAGILKASDIYIHSTHSDGFGIAACEAMASGLPVIASDVPGLSQLIAGAGMLFPDGDDKILTDHVKFLMQSPSCRRQMRLASRLRARRFSIENTVEHCICMYRSVREGSG
ncbi:MAG: glycosyltransferase [Acidobacteriaceae bacterium]|nr:glycosyltransferase [Acidobacteriaceae bacterium]